MVIGQDMSPGLKKMQATPLRGVCQRVWMEPYILMRRGRRAPQNGSPHRFLPHLIFSLPFVARIRFLTGQGGEDWRNRLVTNAKFDTLMGRKGSVHGCQKGH